MRFLSTDREQDFRADFVSTVLDSRQITLDNTNPIRKIRLRYTESSKFLKFLLDRLPIHRRRPRKTPDDLLPFLQCIFQQTHMFVGNQRTAYSPLIFRLRHSGSLLEDGPEIDCSAL